MRLSVYFDEHFISRLSNCALWHCVRAHLSSLLGIIADNNILTGNRKCEKKYLRNSRNKRIRKLNIKKMKEMKQIRGIKETKEIKEVKNKK